MANTIDMPSQTLLMTYILRGKHVEELRPHFFSEGGSYPVHPVTVEDSGMDWTEETVWLAIEISDTLYAIAPNEMNRVEQLPNGDYRINTR